MNTCKIFIISILTILLFTSCEEVIVLELDDTTPRIVIEGTIDMTTQSAKMIFTKSNGFYEDTAPNTVSGVNAILQNEIGTSIQLSETAPGIYTAANVDAKPGEKWTINVESEGVIYTAATTAPYSASLDTLIADIEQRPFGGETEIRLLAEWNDELGIANFYRLRSFQNDILVTQSYSLTNDEFSDGKRISIPIMEEFGLGNLVRIELLSVDENYHRYFLELSSVVGSGFSSSNPYNPIGNFDNNALGYFGIFYVSAMEIQL